MHQDTRATNAPSRIWYQSFTDPQAQRPYIERLRAHLAAVTDPEFTCEVYGITPPDIHFHLLTEFRIAAQVIRNALEAERQGFAAFVIRAGRRRVIRVDVSDAPRRH